MSKGIITITKITDEYVHETAIEEGIPVARKDMSVKPDVIKYEYGAVVRGCRGRRPIGDRRDDIGREYNYIEERGGKVRSYVRYENCEGYERVPRYSVPDINEKRYDETSVDSKESKVESVARAPGP